MWRPRPHRQLALRRRHPQRLRPRLVAARLRRARTGGASRRPYPAAPAASRPAPSQRVRTRQKLPLCMLAILPSWARQRASGQHALPPLQSARVRQAGAALQQCPRERVASSTRARPCLHGGALAPARWAGLRTGTARSCRCFRRGWPGRPGKASAGGAQGRRQRKAGVLADAGRAPASCPWPGRTRQSPRRPRPAGSSPPPAARPCSRAARARAPRPRSASEQRPARRRPAVQACVARWVR